MEHFAYFALTSNLNQCSETCQLFVPPLKSGIGISWLRYWALAADEVSRAEVRSQPSEICNALSPFCFASFSPSFWHRSPKKPWFPFPHQDRKQYVQGPLETWKFNVALHHKTWSISILLLNDENMLTYFRRGKSCPWSHFVDPNESSPFGDDHWIKSSLMRGSHTHINVKRHLGQYARLPKVQTCQKRRRTGCVNSHPGFLWPWGARSRNLACAPFDKSVFS